MTNFDYLYNPDACKKAFEKNYFLDRKLGFQVIEHGTILPHKRGNDWIGLGGIVDGKGEFVSGSTIQPGNRGYPPTELIQKRNETVIYLGFFYPVWGHSIADNLSRMWFLQSEDFKREFKDCPLVYIPWNGSNLETMKSFRRLLEILEFDFDKLKPITQPSRFEKIIMPDKSFSAREGYTKEYKETMNCVIDFALKNRTPTSNKKIYYLYGTRSVGEIRLAEYLKSKGYEIISPEKLSLDEQLNLLINCESFASTLGSCAHNSVFLRDGTETIIIPRGAGRIPVPGYQRQMDQIRSLNVTYIDSSMSLFISPWDDYCFIISEQLKRFFGEKWNGYEEDDFKVFLQYFKKSTGKGLTFHHELKKYYGTTFPDFIEQLKRREDLIMAYNMPPRWETFQQLPLNDGLSYQTHVDWHGWGAWQSKNQISNPLDQKRDLQAVKINFPNHKVYYSVYYNETEGWSAEVSDGEQAGTTGKRKPIHGIKIRLDEAGDKEFDILYRVHTFDGEWTPWAKNGEAIYSHGVKLNALQIKLEPKAAS